MDVISLMLSLGRGQGRICCIWSHSVGRHVRLDRALSPTLYPMRNNFSANVTGTRY